MTDIDSIRQQLTDKLAILEARDRRIEAHQGNPEREIPKDWHEAAVVRDNDDVVNALDAHTKRDILMIHAAIERLNNGTWGICSRCGATISAARLARLPATPFCASCAGSLETRK